MQKFEVIQSKLGRVALGASGYTAVEALRGDMGWSTFSERCMKGCIGYNIRIERMSNEILVKKVYDHVGVRSKWLKVCKCCDQMWIKIWSRLDPSGRVSMWQIESTSKEGEFWSSSI